MTRNLNKRLKHALIEKELKQRQVARGAGISEATFSLIVNGIYIPSEAQQIAIARILGESPEELFNNDHPHGPREGSGT